MSFPFGGFKSPQKRKKGRYSGADRDFLAEMQYDEGDPDPYRDRLSMAEDPEARARYEKCWQNNVSVKKDLYKDLDLQVYALGQSHMDIAWLWRLYQIVNKSKITFTKAAFHVKHLSEFKFTFSQPLMLEWLRLADPDAFEEVKEAIATGRFELQGGMWVECDAKVPSGESFCRQRLYGQRYYQKHFGKMAEIEWLPDSFGYNNNIPQFANKSGCRYFYTQKISGNWPPHAFPFVHFKWRSPDGSEVITYSNNFQFRPLTRWNLFSKHRKLVKPGEELMCDYSHPDPIEDPKMGDIWPVITIMYGQGDGGHGPTSEEVHRMRYFIEKGYVKGFLSAKEYFTMYEEIADRLPVWNGAELFYNLHRGTLTTQGLMKRMNRVFEGNLTALQSIYAYTRFARGESIPVKEAEEFERLWKDVLLLQFHDILPGSSVSEIYDDCYDMWLEMRQDVRNLQTNLIDLIGGGKPETVAILSDDTIIMVTNGSDFTGFAPIEVDIEAGQIPENLNPWVEDQRGNLIPIQIVAPLDFDDILLRRPTRVVFNVQIEAWSTITFKFTTKSLSADEATKLQFKESPTSFRFETASSVIEISRETGGITSYVDKRLGKSGEEIFQAPGNIPFVFQDWSYNEPAWNLGPGYRKMPFDEEEIALRSVTVIEKGPVRWAVEVQTELLETGTILIGRTYIYNEMPGLFFEMQTDWHHTDALVKTQFTFTTEADTVVAEGPYTSEISTADPTKKHHLEAERWEACAHTWVAFPGATDKVRETSPVQVIQTVSSEKDNLWGVMYLNDCKYGFDVIGSQLGITVVRGPKYPPATGYVSEERKGRQDAGPPEYADQGEHFLRYAIIPYQGSWHSNPWIKFAHYYNHRAFAELVKIEPSRKSTADAMPMISVVASEGTNNLEIAAMKAPEDLPDSESALILRVVETGRLITEGTLNIPKELAVVDIQLVDLLERPITKPPLRIQKDGNVVVGCTLHWNPHEIHTLLLKKQ